MVGWSGFPGCLPPWGPGRPWQFRAPAPGGTGNPMAEPYTLGIAAGPPSGLLRQSPWGGRRSPPPPSQGPWPPLAWPCSCRGVPAGRGCP